MLDRASVEIRAFYRWIKKLTDSGIYVMAISGTPSHDAVAGYELMRDMAGLDDYIQINTVPYLLEDMAHEINIAFLPGMNRSNIMTRDEYRDMPLRDVHRVMSQKITDVAQGLRARAMNDWPTILLSHLTYSKAKTGFDQLLLENEPILTTEAIQGFDLCALGHIHEAQTIPDDNVFYAGSPERLSFSEADNTPGFWIHDICDDKSVSSWFIETPARRYATVYGDIHSTYEQWRDASIGVRDAVVRCICDMSEEMSKTTSRKDIEKSLYADGAYFVQEIKIEVERALRARDKEVTEVLGPVQALVKWCDKQGIADGDVPQLMDLTQELLKEAI
jgi:DNA repair exonuclease SbcCD nuclease subunit